jgi:hypothetical protein
LALDDRDHCVCSYINASGAALWKPRRPFAPLVGVTALLFFWAGLAPAGSPAARTRKAKGTASHPKPDMFSIVLNCFQFAGKESNNVH